MSPTVYVIAKDQLHFEKWCWKQDPNGELPDVKYVRSVKVLQRVQPGSVFLFLTGGAKRPEGEKPYWQQRADWRTIYNKVLSIRGRR
jgi:hypothetical protein